MADKQPIRNEATSNTDLLIKESITEVVAPSMIISDFLAKWFSESNSVNILVAGKTGTGKSTLINGIVGEEVTEEGDKLSSQTVGVKPIQRKINDITVCIFDSPGLQDNSASNDDRYIAEIRAKCGNNIDLFLYCIRMSEIRFPPNCEDFVAMSGLTEALGPKLWKNGMIVFTFANDILVFGKHKPNLPEYFRKYYEKASLKICQFLQEEIKLDAEILSQVSIVCAGHPNEPILPSISDQMLGDCHWLSHLWLKALQKTKLRAQPALVKMNVNRIKSEEYFPDEKRQAVSEVTDFPPIMLSKAGTIIGDEIAGKGNLGAVIGDVKSQQIVSQIKHFLGIDSESDEYLRAVWLIITLIPRSTEGQPITDTSTITVYD